MVGAYGQSVEMMDEEEWANRHKTAVTGVHNLPPTTVG